jgi:L-iditol 2-dehydrogenase
VVNVAKEDIREIVVSENGGEGADTVIETAGSDKTIGQTAYWCARGAKSSRWGWRWRRSFHTNFAQIMAKEASIRSVSVTLHLS